MPTFVYMTRCDGCGHCVDICPSDIMHIDKTYRRAYNIEPNMCWECYSCVKACPQNAIDMRGFADQPEDGGNHAAYIGRLEQQAARARRGAGVARVRRGARRGYRPSPQPTRVTQQNGYAFRHAHPGGGRRREGSAPP